MLSLVDCFALSAELVVVFWLKKSASALLLLALLSVGAGVVLAAGAAALTKALKPPFEAFPLLLPDGQRK